MNVTVFGPNLPRRLSDKGTIHVHKTGCRDIKTHRYPTGADQGGWDVLRDVSSIAEIVEDVYPSSDFCYDPEDPDQVAGYRQDIYIAPCVDLPERVQLGPSEEDVQSALVALKAELEANAPAILAILADEDVEGSADVLGKTVVVVDWSGFGPDSAHVFDTRAEAEVWAKGYASRQYRILDV